MAWSKESFEANGRQLKAARLTLAVGDFFEELGGPPDAVIIATVEAWQTIDWAAIAARAEVRMPSPTTRELVIKLLKARAARRARS